MGERARRASFISRASTLRARYSGVRPTIIPARNTAVMTYRNMLISPTPTPPKVTFSHMSIIGISPVSGLRLSCIAFTLPFLVLVVLTAQKGPASLPKRSSFPSRFVDSATAKPRSAAVGRAQIYCEAMKPT